MHVLPAEPQMMFASSLEIIPWGIQKAKTHHPENATNYK